MSTKAEMIRAPFTQAQVVGLNRWQRAGYVHEFTCACGEILQATLEGWRCPDACCDYTQDWAHAFMADGPPEPHPIVRFEEPDECMFCLDLGLNRPEGSGEFWNCPECGALYGDCNADD